MICAIIEGIPSHLVTCRPYCQVCVHVDLILYMYNYQGYILDRDPRDCFVGGSLIVSCVTVWRYCVALSGPYCTAVVSVPTKMEAVACIFYIWLR